MPEYAGALRGARLRRMDNLSRERHDFDKDMRNRNYDLSLNRHNFNKDMQLKNMDMRRNEIAKRDARDQRDSKFRHRVQSFREKLANYDLEAKQEDRQYAKSLRDTMTKVNTLPYDVVADLANFASGKTTNGGFKNFTTAQRTEDNGIVAKDINGNVHTFSPMEIHAIVQTHSARENNRIKNQRENEKIAFSRNQTMEKNRMKRLQPMKNVRGYFFQELKNQGYDTSGFTDKEGYDTALGIDFFDSVQYYRSQGMDDRTALRRAATHAGIHRLQDYQDELAGVEKQLATAESNGERGYLWDTGNYNNLQSRQGELKSKISSMSNGKNRLTRQVSKKDIQALTWAQRNPDNPRSREILKHLSQKYSRM